MLRQCVSPNQRDWVQKLPLIEFAMNIARSETTGFAPFFLNSGMMPRAMIWDAKSEYPGITSARHMKDAIMAAHDAILQARVKQTRVANNHRRPAPFNEGELCIGTFQRIVCIDFDDRPRQRRLIVQLLGV